MKYYVIKIRNNSVSSLNEAPDEETAKKMVRDMFFGQAGREMNDEETEDLELQLECYLDLDHDNQYNFSVNIIDY